MKPNKHNFLVLNMLATLSSMFVLSYPLSGNSFCCFPESGIHIVGTEPAPSHRYITTPSHRKSPTARVDTDPREERVGHTVSGGRVIRLAAKKCSSSREWPATRQRVQSPERASFSAALYTSFWSRWENRDADSDTVAATGICQQQTGCLSMWQKAAARKGCAPFSSAWPLYSRELESSSSLRWRRGERHPRGISGACTRSSAIRLSCTSLPGRRWTTSVYTIHGIATCPADATTPTRWPSFCAHGSRHRQESIDHRTLVCKRSRNHRWRGER